MTKILIIILLFFSLGSQAQESNQKQKDIYFGYGLFLNYNLYSWYQNPAANSNVASSCGQVLNIIPGLGFNFWLGDIEHWILTIESGVEYNPFAIDLEHYTGMGALGFPTMAKVYFPVAKQKSLWLMFHGGIGCHMISTNLYNRPLSAQAIANSFYTNIIGELGIHIAAVGHNRKQIKEIEYFIRIGGGAFNSINLNTGIRITFWNRLAP
jgi:hypothetical protein